jgi:hypothetical protein
MSGSTHVHEKEEEEEEEGPWSRLPAASVPNFEQAGDQENFPRERHVHVELWGPDQGEG